MAVASRCYQRPYNNGTPPAHPGSQTGFTRELEAYRGTPRARLRRSPSDDPAAPATVLQVSCDGCFPALSCLCHGSEAMPVPHDWEGPEQHVSPRSPRSVSSSRHFRCSGESFVWYAFVFVCIPPLSSDHGVWSLGSVLCCSIQVPGRVGQGENSVIINRVIIPVASSCLPVSLVLPRYLCYHDLFIFQRPT